MDLDLVAILGGWSEELELKLDRSPWDKDPITVMFWTVWIFPCSWTPSFSYLRMGLRRGESGDSGAQKGVHCGLLQESMESHLDTDVLRGHRGEVSRTASWRRWSMALSLLRRSGATSHRSISSEKLSKRLTSKDKADSALGCSPSWLTVTSWTSSPISKLLFRDLAMVEGMRRWWIDGRRL